MRGDAIDGIIVLLGSVINMLETDASNIGQASIEGWMIGVVTLLIFIMFYSLSLGRKMQYKCKVRC